jgi:hypothetical protein
MLHHRWLVARFHHENCRRDNLASTSLAMNQSIFFVSAPIFFAFVLGLGFLFLCFLDRLRKKTNLSRLQLRCRPHRRVVRPAMRHAEIPGVWHA